MPKLPRIPRTNLNSRNAQIRKALFYAGKKRGFQAKVARKLNLSSQQISQIARQMIAEGIIEKNKPAKQQIKKKRIGRFPHTVLGSKTAILRKALFYSRRKSGYLKEIAEQTGASLSTISSTVGKMRAEGILPPKTPAAKNERQRSTPKIKGMSNAEKRASSIDAKATEAVSNIQDRSERMRAFMEFVRKQAPPKVQALMNSVKTRITFLRKSKKNPQELASLEIALKKARNAPVDEAVKILQNAIKKT